MTGAGTAEAGRQVAIIGAGVSGLALAIRLLQTGWTVEIFEARGEEAIGDGAFLTLAPNGINALRALGLAERIFGRGIPTIGFEILNAAGKRIARLDEREDQRRAGAASVTLKRCDLLDVLLGEAKRAGARIRFGHVLTGIERDGDGVTLNFTNGATTAAEWIAGCDGVWSRTRRLAFPGAPDPVYTGLTGTGGFLDLPSVAPTDGFMRMVFGEHAFFGYIKEGDGPVFWFDSFALDEETAVARPDPTMLAALARELHATDPAPVCDIAAGISQLPRAYPVFDMAHLPCWYDDRVVLLGDAAHAVSPHAGQGASMAIEDAVVLAACLGAHPAPAEAFAAYQGLRRDRVERIVRMSRRRGSQKRVQGRLALFLRDLILPLVIPVMARRQRDVTLYRADLDPLVKPR
ncbi:FAD-dependent oxidoreductase [Mesorhizobium sp. L-8-3]|uniref:FAD-dependent oxidoreductase n=1 Tax=Mesorhizobium sp. L-8-3 TaxID=2744522 RepID=UPI00192536DD|nr:NAD(P)/FAD-dependent oxidoreductase [Mesorhizobium sp. L-8-3]BCH27917.1 FAD-dependent oxidoreductase [Mesorhizobium sp. L-8-3]